MQRADCSREEKNGERKINARKTKEKRKLLKKSSLEVCQ
jgi:hypothetical protein